MIANSAHYELFASYTVPDPAEVGYWVDLGANADGKVIKTYNKNLKKWVKMTDATSEDAVAPFIGNNGNWWIDNRDTGVNAYGEDATINGVKTAIIKGGKGINVTQNGNELYVESDIDKSDLNNYTTKEEVDDKIKDAITSVYKVKGSVESYNQLPTVDVEVGDVYNVLDNGANYVAISVSPVIVWDRLSETVDLSDISAEVAKKIDEAPKDNIPYVRKDGEWVDMHDQYENEDIAILIMDIFDSMGKVEKISQEYYNKLSSICPPGKIAYAHWRNENIDTAPIGLKGMIFKIWNESGDFQIFSNVPYHVFNGHYSYMLQISADLTVTGGMAYGYVYPEPLDTGETSLAITEVMVAVDNGESNQVVSSINLISGGDGTKFLSNSGEYLPIEQDAEIHIGDSEPTGNESIWINTNENYKGLTPGKNINVTEEVDGLHVSVVDGKGSGLNADLLDGKSSEEFVNRVTFGKVPDYVISVIKLFELRENNTGKQNYSYGIIEGHRENGLSQHGPSTVIYQAVQNYGLLKVNCGMLSLGSMWVKSQELHGFKFCTFTYEGKTCFGIYNFPNTANNYVLNIYGGNWTETPTLINVYKTNTDTVLNEEIWNSLSTEGDHIALQDAYINDKQILTSEAFTEDILSYGVQWRIGSTYSELTRIGNSDFHRTLPIQSKMRGCTLADDGTVNHYFNSDWTANIDGTAIIKDGSDGMVMIEIPEHYVKYEVVDGYNTIRLSEIQLAGYTKVNKQYISAYEATVDRTDSTKFKLASVVNNSVEFRGGTNNNLWDNRENTLLGKPLTNASRDNFRTYARNRGNENEYYWNMYDFIAHNTLYTLYIVEYANLNSQLAVNSTLTLNGYKQGGLGNGISNIDSTIWGTFNNYNPVIPCGCSDSLGNNSGEVAYTMPASYGTLTTYVNRYRGIENPFGHMWKNVDGIIFDIKTDADGGTSTIYITTNPEKYKDSVDEGYTVIGELPRTNGYGKSLYLGTFFPSATGGSATTGLCDYFYTNLSSSSLRTCLIGGAAHNSELTGFGCMHSGVLSIAHHDAYVGSRLIFRKQ